MSETKTMSSTKTTSTEQVRFLTVTAIGIALVYVFTWLINIRLPFAPQGGLIHLGNVPLFIFAILFGLHAVWWAIPIAEIVSLITSTILLKRIYRLKIARL